ncbi:hypothetical protein [Bradyrhizobium nitroreducens]|uniref:hypothetical protein n=2 Tax=Bradyrhizobium TaxID=374 RepID=UPI001FDF5F03|nr:hypothetical protein [Bradyrhizobium nitroreducens]
MPLEHEAIGPDPFVDREQPSARLDRARRINGLDQSDKEFNSVVRHQLGLLRQVEGKSPVPTEETTEQESTTQTVSSGPPGRILVDLQAGLQAQACARPQLDTQAAHPRKVKRDDPYGVLADESYCVFLAFFDVPSTERLASTSFSAD